MMNLQGDSARSCANNFAATNNLPSVFNLNAVCEVLRNVLEKAVSLNLTLCIHVLWVGLELRVWFTIVMRPLPSFEVSKRFN